jgi:hypothetical protein
MADLGEIVRAEFGEYVRSRFATPHQRKAMCDIAGCRTISMGSVSIACEQCHGEYRLYRSCRNRSCPSCQNEAQHVWVEARQAEILPVEYLHVVFNVPAHLNVVAQYCPEPLYDAVIRAAGQAVIDVGRSELQIHLGCHAHLQTWTQLMAFLVHVHCVVPCGGFSVNGSEWMSFEPDDLPAEALSRRFRELLCKNIRAAARNGEFDCLSETVSIEHLLAQLMKRPWRVYSKPPFGGAEKLFEYLGRYTHRVAITNDRIDSYANHQVTFRWRESGKGSVEKPCTLDAQEFVRRFVKHVPPRGFVRIRSYGFLANRNRKQNIERARRLIGRVGPSQTREPFRPRRLCPACARRDETTLHFVPSSDVSPQFALSVRPPPISPFAA